MTSTLQEQLQRLASAAGIASGKAPRGKPSLLYTTQNAADIGIQDIYAVAVQGFDQLCRVDPRFQAYRKTLFSQSTQTLDRDQQTPEINSKLDASIAGFCALLSSYFLLPAAFKSLEYLIRRFKVHEMNVPALMHAALPYHATNEFVRLVQILRLDNTLFAFLQPMQKSGVALPRSLLVQRCLTDRSLLRFVCDAAQELGGPRVAARAVMPFFAALLCEIVAAVPAVDEPFLSMLLPYIVHGLSADVAPDYRAAVYMALVQLATRATFSADLNAALVLELCKSATPAGLPQALLVLCHLGVTQPEFAVFPDNAFKHLAKLPGLSGELLILSSKGGRTQRLLALVITAAAGHVNAHENYARLMDEVLSTVLLGVEAATLVLQKLLAMAATGAAEGPQGAAVLKSLRTFDLRYPDVTEKAVNAALQRLSGGKTPEEVAAKERLSNTLHTAFAGSLRAPMIEAGTTLALAVDAASAGIRRLALEKLDALANEHQHQQEQNGSDGGVSSIGAEAEEVLRGALLRRLTDDHPAVVQTALGLESLLRLPPAALLESLAHCLSSALTAATQKSTKKSDRAAARGIARKIVKLLAGPFTDAHPEDVDRAAELVLTAVVAAPHTRKVAESAVKKGRKVNHPLLRALVNADIESAAAAAAAAENPNSTTVATAAASTSKSPAKSRRGATAVAAAKKKKDEKSTAGAAAVGKGAKGYDDVAHNRAVIDALSRASSAEGDDAQQALSVLLNSSEPRTRALVLVVVNQAMRLKGGVSLAAAVLHRFGDEFSRSDNSSSSSSSNGDEVVVAVFGDGGKPDESTLMALATGVLQPIHLEPAVVLTALQVLPSAALQSLGREGLERLFSRLCTLSSSSSSSAAAVWSSHLEVLIARAGEVLDAVQFLQDLWGAPTESKPYPGDAIRVQTVALELWTQAVLAPSPTSPTKTGKGRGNKNNNTSDAPNTAIIALPRLLSLLGHSDRSMRSAAVATCGALADGVDSWWLSSEFEAGTVFFDKSAAAAVLHSIHTHSAAIVQDSEAAEALLRNAMEIDGTITTAEISPSKAAARKKKISNSTTKNKISTRLDVDISQATALRDFLLEQLPLQTGATGLSAVAFLIQIIHDAAEPAALLLAAHRLLRTFVLTEGPHPVLRPLTSPLERDVAALLVEMYNEPALLVLLKESTLSEEEQEEKGVDVVNSLLAMVAVPGPEGSIKVRKVALESAFTPSVFSALPGDSQQAAFVALTAASTQDVDQPCRDAAHAALASLPITAHTLLPLLTISSPPPPASEGNRHKKRRGSLSSPTPAAVSGGAGLGAGFSTFLATLEVLQWKDDVADAVQIVPQLQLTVEDILKSISHSTSAAAAAQEEADASGTLDTTVLPPPTAAALQEEAEQRSATVASQAYALQLALALMNTLAERTLSSSITPTSMEIDDDDDDAKKKKKPTPSKTTSKKSSTVENHHHQGFDIGVAVHCAQAAPDAAVRSAALKLIGTLAAVMPEDALNHVLTVVAVVGDASAAELFDAHSSAVAAQSLGAVAAAWMRSGGDMQQLVDAVVAAVAAAPALRRLSLVRALAGALPEIDGGCLVLLGLLQLQLDATHEGDDDDDDDDDEEWGVTLATALLQQSSPVVQAQTLAKLLETAMTRHSDNPAAPIVLISTALATSRLGAAPSRESGTKDDESLQAAYELLMQRALAQMQRVGELTGLAAAAAAAPRSNTTKNTKSAVKTPPTELLKTATKAAYALTEALQHVMSPDSYVSGLVGLVSGGNSDKIRRRALSLLSAGIKSEQGHRGATGKEAAPALVAAALGVVEPITTLLMTTTSTTTTTDLTRQVALFTLGSLSQAYAATHPRPFLTAMPTVLELTKPEESQAVRSSALACIAAVAQSLGPQLVPVLPPTVNAVLSAAQNAAEIISSTSLPSSSSAAAAAAASAAVDVDSDEDIEQGSRKSSSSVKEGAALELAASLSALSSLVSRLGAFLAPYLTQIFAVVLRPTVLSCKAAQCAALAASIRGKLAQDVPARLLLTPLAESLDTAAAAGVDSTCALLSMLGVAIESMNGEAVAVYHDAVFMQLLRALDLRRTAAVGPPASPAADAVEMAAIHALVELTLKLSESRFKPLFFRLVEWATAVPATEVGAPAAAASSLPRAVALLAAANALSERLRSVFTPYFQPLLEPILAALDKDGSGATATTTPSKKKRKKAVAATAASGGGDGVLPPPELAPLESVRRLLAIRALHRCFLHDTTGYLDEARFDRLLQPLVTQLHVAPLPEELPFLTPDPTLEAALSPEAVQQLDVPARALVACLAQMALAAGGGDARWRPLNHAVLMATRSPELRTRLAALEATAALAVALQEEYLPLLPEALPFLAELLEDGQHVVEARATAALRALETLSGEDLKEYLK